MYVGTSKQLKAYDQGLLDYGYTIEQLVDKASDCLYKYFNEYERITIVCGPGNNGADGLSLALKLADDGKAVRVFNAGNIDKLSQANRYYMSLVQDSDVEDYFLEQENYHKFVEALSDSDCVVDAMFGFGLNSEVRGIYKDIIQDVNSGSNYDIIAIDIPTGLHPDTGIPFLNVIYATKTITLTALKQGFLTEGADMYTGELHLELLDAVDLFQQIGLAELVDRSWVKEHLKPRKFDGHKGTYGKVLCITGCSQYRGAALLSAKSAVYSGSGLVTVFSKSEVVDSLVLTCPEATSKIRPTKIEKEDLEGYTAVLLGSGLGLSPESYGIVLDVLKYAKCPIVIDGDALTIISQNEDLYTNLKVPVILTPHLGEFKRLNKNFDDQQLVIEAKKFAKEHHVILVLKGPHTIISDGEKVYRNTTGNKAMATAGCGDVLAGMVTSFTGQQYDPFVAAILGVYLHSLAGDEAAKNCYTALPSRMIEKIPHIMFDILEK